MEDADRATPDPVDRLQQYADRPWMLGFYQAMRLVEATHRKRPRLGRSTRPAQDAVRLAQDPSVQFAPAMLSGMEQGADGMPSRLLVHFFGLFGPDGPLPLHLTEFARARREQARDHTFYRFADMFHHRLLSLFWRAWADSRPAVSFDRPEEDRFGFYVAALSGYAAEALQDGDAMPDLSRRYFAGLLANQSRHAEGLAALLSAFFDVPVQIACFIGAWLTLPVHERTRLGGGDTTASLGRTAMLGGRVWTRQQKIRLVFGPLSLRDYERLLPGGNSFRRLVPIMRTYAGDTMLWDVNLVLRDSEVPATRLGRAGRLGWTTWLMPRRTGRDAADLFLNASADSMAQKIDNAARPMPQEATP